MDKVLFVLRKGCEEMREDFTSPLFESELVCDCILALRKIKKEKYKMVVLDMGMDRICGLDLLKILRSNPNNHHLKIIVTARNYNYKYIQECFFQGADFFIKFPFPIADIERIYGNLKDLDDYVDLEAIARYNRFEWLTQI
ncbi:MAG TPA: response regulator [Acholeplasmataceae bacterium]|nr:response regulator [Acholeplasmataceae bacterium]